MHYRDYFVYIMASRKNGALYIGVTSDLEGRIWEHKNDIGSKHVTKYRIYKLVYYEMFSQIEFAIDREKRLKRWRRAWKVELIEKENPQWRDLTPEL